ncbi:MULTISPECIES: UDP-N-acetylmuramoyl-L-alanyl-D-glutamate--2,6-diaminopimelate ligase [Priestia]|uniref:UDP-N-acetylmuramoyl-L-alanyl-D-glutamate--2,6-diaminopimelate ligase n=1 Tax=Priestia megaterium TaxID=1404 RepID=A0AAX6BPZ6_PRIMG|nr:MULTISPECIES: UDP-N-acetylmuramoyl-L-alanyl-D-glutamate--2,6-diaminopimelate ligase [Priestia]MBY0209535.1 UDP-N-acetylmuramoyl-L-alanyl-D-glutamate--2,6-diaminopimelate ligase [Priestia aryabhattai]MCA1051627.1 UDP-N-acetylmuramoyl-L-alanyl-D-glutamate--2,6-diaminopimelate ligase [Priestia aryabhattai]MED3948629.1 UDP-N-acetylmuramoyl-L-alanyl-D-glutamate--2,6-diaminopimelate ligase [Priestia aryabhattai]NGY92446.1 UDP-N-acetylmuramoyl-L-alanyl-D-glutamate--2,6-diaminopimelate ligase [Pries
MDLRELLTHLHDFVQLPEQNIDITSIEMDSREVKPGALFICIDGYTVDGHSFAQMAVEKGAVAILAEKPVDVEVPVVRVKSTKRAMAVLADAFYNQPTQKMHLIGVTGTNGKTTITHLIEHIFKSQHKKTGLIGTIEIRIGDTSYDVKNTTPESLTLQKTFNQMVEENVEVAMMEVSSHALDLGRVHGCDFDVAVFSNLTQDHLDYHHTMEDYRRAKGLLFAQLGNAYNHNRPKFAVLNVDDAATEEYIKNTAATVITYGIDRESDIRATNIQITNSGTTFDLTTPTETVSVEMKLIGKFSVYNVLAATAACLVSGLPLSVIVEEIKVLEGVSGRFEVVDAQQDFTVIVDYAHTPDSLENVLKTVKEFAKRNIYVIVGCGGDRDRTKRPIMARIAAEYSTQAILTSDNPRSEDPLAILKDMEEGLDTDNYVTIADRAEAIRYAVETAHADDVIVIAGKGHETYQIIGKKVFDFDDREVARKMIEERK